MSTPEKEPSGNTEELRSLTEAVCNGTITAAQYERLSALLSADADAARFYATYVRMHGLLLWHWRDGDVGPPSSPAFPVIVETSPLPTVAAPIFGNLFSTSGYLFSYSLAFFIVGIGLLVGWACRMPLSQESVAVAPRLPAAVPAPEQAPVVVGRIIGVADCEWSDTKTGTVSYAPVPLGRKYALASGLLEIAYDSGARVILQGPCTYEVKSRSGGYLELGKATARVEKRADGRRKAESPASDNSRPSAPLFSIGTPTAVVTDLGTEFGVEVDGSGVSRTFVCEGKVELRPVGAGNSKPILLEVNESARVHIGKSGAVAIVRTKGEKNRFVREMPKSVPIELFNTGVNLKEGEPDRHWQVVARSDDAKFQPQPALLRGADENALENDPTRSQWLSLRGGDSTFPEEVVYVFRTTFDLTGMRPSTAIVRGRFLADDRVVAIRLNGRNLNVPLQSEGGPFVYWTKFYASSGFVEGTNVLEFDVLNADPVKSPMERRTARSRMSLRVELEGEAARKPEGTRTNFSDKATRKPASGAYEAASKEPKIPKQDSRPSP